LLQIYATTAFSPFFFLYSFAEKSPAQSIAMTPYRLFFRIV